MDNKTVVTLSHTWVVQKLTNFSVRSTGFFLKLTFHTNKTFETQTHYGLCSHKQPPSLSDHLGLTIYVVAYRIIVGGTVASWLVSSTPD